MKQMCVDMVDVPGSKTIFFEQSFEHRNDVSGHQGSELEETSSAKQNLPSGGLPRLSSQATGDKLFSKHQQIVSQFQDFAGRCFGYHLTNSDWCLSLNPLMVMQAPWNKSTACLDSGVCCTRL